MPKLKTKSGAKKRFKVTGTGKIVAAAQGKRHGMIKRHAKFIRTARGTMVLNDSAQFTRIFSTPSTRCAFVQCNRAIA